MANFDSGVSSYTFGVATVVVPFPVDRRGNEHITCELCKLYSGRKCYLTDELPLYPKMGPGAQCPLVFEEGANDG